MTRTFHCSKMTARLWKRIMKCALTMNASKIGHMRRGSLLLQKVDWDGKRITLQWSSNRGVKRFAANTPSGVRHYKVRLYRYDDHKALLGKLGKLK